MKQIFTTANIAIFLVFFSFFAKAQHQIIPAPVSYIASDDIFVIDQPLSISLNIIDRQLKTYTAQFSEYLGTLGIETNYTGISKQKLSITLLENNNKEIGEEGYLLKITKEEINISANHADGIFNAFQTIKQLLPPPSSIKNTQNSTSINTCEIVDYPRFEWRGLMLDVSRHFFTVEEVKDYIDQMAAYKFNVFHWHLTDDNGWRIEIKSLPKLTEVGAWRVERHGKFGSQRVEPKEGEATPYGGFYTQEDIKEIVQYAADRNISIVPEIDIPGHSMAALAAYPSLSTKKEPKSVNPGTKFADWYGDGTFKMLIENTLNPADEKVYDFIDKVFTEVAELFPGEYIHMGGDECYKGYWEEDPSVLEFMKKNDIKDSHELQSYFVQRVEKIINSKGKRMIGWDEILEGGLAENATVMSWRGMKGGIAAAKMNHQVVMSPTTFAYLDYTQGDYSVENKVYASLNLKKAYEFDPLPEGIDAKYVLGGQANLWTEQIPTLPFAYYMTYPRAFAISESVWSQKESKDWDDFSRRTISHFDRFDASGINICKAEYEPIIEVYKEGDHLMCTLKNNFTNSSIYYTVDNTYPPRTGTLYTKSFVIPEGNLKLRTQTYIDGQAVGRELILTRKILEERAGK